MTILSPLHGRRSNLARRYDKYVRKGCRSPLTPSYDERITFRKVWTSNLDLSVAQRVKAVREAIKLGDDIADSTIERYATRKLSLLTNKYRHQAYGAHP